MVRQRENVAADRLSCVIASKPQLSWDEMARHPGSEAGSRLDGHAGMVEPRALGDYLIAAGKPVTIGRRIYSLDLHDGSQHCRHRPWQRILAAPATAHDCAGLRSN